MGGQTDKVRLNIGGKMFETTATTLASASRNSMFGAMFDDQWNLQPRGGHEEHFIDRDPECFSVLLNLLRTGDLHVPPEVPEKLLYKEALYYGLLDNVRTAMWGRFNGNKLKLKTSVRGIPPHDCTAIRASPDGGCAVVHGSIVHVYDWMLEEREPLNLDYRIVNDIAWIDSENIVVSAGQKLGQGGYGGIGLFSSSSGHLRHRYEFKDQTAGALCFNSDGKIFACCGGTNHNNGVGVWDQVTGKQTDFFDGTYDWPLGDANKIQWLNGSNCLFASSFFPWTNHNRISVLDFRVRREVIWSWSRQAHPTERNVYDAIAMEESDSICVVGDLDDLGFLDMRSTTGSIRWNPRNRENRSYFFPRYAKLAIHGEQVIYSRNDGISVFSGPDSILTSSLGRSCGGLIRDFSIGGDRLFILHSEENVFDVWEAPSTTII